MAVCTIDRTSPSPQESVSKMFSFLDLVSFIIFGYHVCLKHTLVSFFLSVRTNAIHD